jgi:gamma-glutamyltranspeptidase / glutathione hydrolase
MSRVAVAAPSRLAADAGAEITAAGGNAVDVALASVMTAMVTEPGICAPGSGGFLTVAHPTGPVVVYDGYMEMPGRDATAPRFGGGITEVVTEYGGGMRTLIGPGSIATPGAWAAMEDAWSEHGRLPWSAVMAPAIRHVREGFPLGAAAHSYLALMHSWFCEDPAARATLEPDGIPLRVGDPVHIAHLADSLERIAAEGAAALHGGELGARIAAEVAARGGLLRLEDLAGYRAVRREALVDRVAGWEVATNPTPAVGGIALVAMLRLVPATGRVQDVDLVEAQRTVLEYRRDRVDAAPDVEAAVRGLLEAFPTGLRGPLVSPSTVHVSAVDENGLACAVTMSAGYGSGVVPEGTGFWMNNSLGEIELTRAGPATLAPGTRLLSNMAPTIARRPDGEIVAVGSPGADRITTALLITLVALLLEGRGLDASVHRPRLHVEFTEGGTRVAHEPGVDLHGLNLPTRPFDALHMFFGGVAAAARLPDGRLEAVADPRRQGGARVG